MKVIFCNNYRNISGWSAQGIEFILALDYASVNIVPRFIKLLNNSSEVPERIKELEEQSVQDAVICIQHTIPQFMERTLLYDIGLYNSETTSLPYTWVNHLNLMDEVWVLNEQMQQVAEQSGVHTPIHIVHQPINVEKFYQNYEPLFDKKNKFYFYTIIDYCRRKNLAALLKAFYTEFRYNEPVELIIKISKSGTDATRFCQDYCNDIKKALKLGNYKSEIILGMPLNNNEINRLHYTGDCFVLPSRGESVSLVTLDAVGFGSTPIVSDCTGFHDYITNEIGWLVPGQYDICWGEMETFDNLYTGAEGWCEVSSLRLAQIMREVYENKQLKAEKAQRGLEYIERFSYQNTGSRLKEILNAQKR